MIDFTEWEQRKSRNKQTRSDFATIKAHIATAQDAQDGHACVDNGEVVWMASAEKERALQRQKRDVFMVIGGLVYPA